MKVRKEGVTAEEFKRLLEVNGRITRIAQDEFGGMGVGYLLLSVYHDEGSPVVWSANVHHEDLIRALKELVERLEAGTANTRGIA